MGDLGDSGFEIHLVTERPDLERLLGVFAQVWGSGDGLSSTSGSQSVGLSVDVLRALAHTGSYLAVVVGRDGAMVGASLGFRGVHHGRPSLHSHITGIVPDRAHSGLGRALKQHQRRWAAAEGLECITWTFDPLVRRNGWFNLQTLGAEVAEYLVDFYGPLNDAINGDDATDRLLAVWWVDGARTLAAADGRLAAIASVDLPDAHVLLGIDDAGRPSRHAVPHDVETLLVSVPRDIVEIRTADRPTADRWRHAVRDTLGSAMDDGWSITDMTTDGRYVLCKTEER